MANVTPIKMFTLPPDFQWIPPWEPIEDESVVLAGRQLLADFVSQMQGGPLEAVADSIVAELRREMTPEHRLASCAIQAIGRCRDDVDEILFLTDDPIAPLAVVHLTWRAESCPYTILYPSLADWIFQMKRESCGVRWVNLTEDRE